MNDAKRIMDACTCPGGHVARVTAGDLNGGPHASTYVCGREVHQAAAREWVAEKTGLTPTTVPLPGVTPSLFEATS